jgi:DNA-binding transcriptional ArsR family regulator
MLKNDFVTLNDGRIAIPLLQNIIDETALKIISSTIDVPKNVFQICYDNKIPLSSTYRKIRKLQEEGLVSIEKIEVDGKGKRVALYRSNIKSLDFNLKKESVLLQFEQNDGFLSK